jgi:hypothetical protein
MDQCYQEKVCNCRRDCECDEGYECCSENTAKPTLGVCVKKDTCNKATGLCQTKKPGFIASVKELITVTVKENYGGDDKSKLISIILGSLVLLAFILLIILTVRGYRLLKK